MTMTVNRKVALLKLGARITVSDNNSSGATGEALAIANLAKCAGYDVDIYTKILKSDKPTFKYNIYDMDTCYKDITSSNYDAIFVVNGKINYFGGQDQPYQTKIYEVINSFDGKIFYMLCDPAIPLQDVYSVVETKPWASQYSKDKLTIVRDDIIYICQPRNLTGVLDIANKYISIDKISHFPFEKFPMLSENTISFNDNPVYDILYGGTFRQGKRQADMIKFYFGYPDNYNVTMFGNIGIKNFDSSKIAGLAHPTFESTVSYNGFNAKMNKSKSTVIIGDTLYKKLDDLAQRIYESIMSNIVVFIDSTYDVNKHVFGSDDELSEFCYVSNRDDVMSKLEQLNDIEFRRHIVSRQNEVINFNKDTYISQFREIIDSYL